MNKAFVLKARVAAYWRYEKQCGLVALEASTRLVGWNQGGQSDVLVLTDQNMVIETEVKLTAGDLRKDRDKAKHYHFYLDYFGRQDYLMPEVKAWKKHEQWLAQRAISEAREYTYLCSQLDYLRTDAKNKEKHKELIAGKTAHKYEYNYPVSRFYFAVPEDLRNEAKSICEELYPYAGLLIIQKVDTPGYDWEVSYNNPISMARHPFPFRREPLDDDQLMHMQREMSATICRLAHKLATAQSKAK